MPNNYVLLETIALTQSAASVTFDNLPTSGYTDLKIVASTRWSNTGPDGFYISFNGSTASFTSKVIEGSGSAASSASPARLVGGLEGTGYTANTFGSSEIYIPNYRSSNYKSYSADAVTENNATQAFSQLIAGLWSSVDAITSIGLAPTSGSFVANSTFSLYGIAAYGTTPVTAPKATGGNIVANDGTYWYHAFTSSGYFVPQVGLTADVLVIAGGGGGGGDSAGGGGAGGLLLHSSQALSTTSYSATVGAGGAGGTGQARGVSGNNSIFGALTASVGGGGGAASGGGSNWYGLNGGSGGGATGDTSAYKGLGTSGQGNDGAISTVGGNGGGGGKGTTGFTGYAAGTGAVGGNGGTGVNTYSSWATATNTGVSGYFAGGGGGGGYTQAGTLNAASTGGAGGGGNGGNYSNNSAARVVPTAAVANTGSGGGGDGWFGQAGKAGGSGIIIIRYPIA